MIHQSFKPKIRISDITSKIEGEDLSEMTRIWKDTAASEMRMNLLTTLKGKKLGLNEIENFSLGLRYNFKSDKMKEMKDKPLENVIQTAMATKMKDEIHHHYELRHKREIHKKRLAGIHHPKTKTYKKIIGYLRGEAEEIRRIQEEKYREKVAHIEKRYRDTEIEELSAPENMKEYGHIRVFDEEKYEEIIKDRIEVPTIGEIELTEEEKTVLRRNPKFAILQNLEENTIKEDMEKAYSLIRMELRDEDAEDREKEKEEENQKDTGGMSEEEETKLQEKERIEKEEMAKTRQVYDPIKKIYDERKRRVTDLVECSRVVLPKPLSVTREAEIETRRKIHDKIYQRYRIENCNDRGEQEDNMTREEKKGLKSLMKKLNKGEILIMKTDKSGKMSATNREKYIEMGQAHIGEDKEVDRVKIIETDRILNEHSAAWCSMWSTRQDPTQQNQ